MPFVEAIWLALAQIRVQKLKSFFTLLGVCIGVMFLIAVISIVQGMSSYMENDFAAKMLGVNTFTLRRFPWFGDGAGSEEEWRSWLRRPRIYHSDLPLVASVQATLYLLIVTLLYGVPFRGNLLVFYTAVLTFAEACAGVGLFISSLVRTQQQAFLGAFAVLLPFALLSGFATPIENMPWWLQFLTTINPLAHMLRLMQGLFLKGASVASLAQDLLRLLEIALCTTAAAVLLFRRKAA